MVPSIASQIANQGNIAATNTINQANVATNLIDQLAMLGAYKVNPKLFSG